jgi:hypothetical protein
MTTRPEKTSHTQLRLLRLRYDELNREFGKLKNKGDYEDYTIRLRSIVETALKNAGFDETPVFIDRSRRARVPISELRDKGNVLVR